MTLAAAASNPAIIEWQTTKPYESAVSVRPGARLRLENITVRHSSPSVANNYAVFCQGGSLEAVNCNISSTTGSGIGMEGGSAFVSDSQIQGCKGSGAVVAGALVTSETELDVGQDAAVPKVWSHHACQC